MYNDIAQRLTFALSENGEFLNNTAYFLISNNETVLPYLLKILNSKLIDWYYRTLSVQLGEKAVRMFSIYVLKIPIPIIENGCDLSDCTNETDINENVYGLYNLTQNEIDFIEDREV